MSEKFDASSSYGEVELDDAWRDSTSPEIRANLKNWATVPARKIILDHPLQLDIETTTKCNLKCPFCPRTQMIEAGEFADESAFMSRDDYLRIINQAVRIGVRSLKLNYLGEPLLHKNVAWQVGVAKIAGISMVVMNSNGTALTKKNARELLRAGLDGLFISLDAANPADYEAQRVGASFGKVVDNIYGFDKLRRELRPSCQLRISMILYDDPKWEEQFRALQAMWRGVADAVGASRHVDHSNIAGGNAYPEVPGWWCAQPFQRLMLKNNGNATICCFDSADEAIVGNWKKESISDIWNGPRHREIVEKHAAGRYFDIPLCRKCFLPLAEKPA